MSRRLIFILVFAVVFAKQAFSIVPVLEREVTLNFNKESITVVLDKIREQTGAVFSFQSSIINQIPLVTYQFRKKTIREVLSIILPKTIVFKAKSNYIILKERPLEKEPEKKELSGYVYEKNTDKKIANVTIYDKKTLQSATTDKYGYYSISLSKDYQCLTVNKENYRDTCLAIIQKEEPITNISIDPLRDSSNQLKFSKKLKDFSGATNELFKKFKGYINTINVKDTLTRNFQIALVPFMGTNGLLSANVYNKYSINVFGGYAKGNRALELGGFFNVDKENVMGAQFAGFFNVVGDSMMGGQFAGFFNIVGRHTNGVQMAGFANLNIGTLTGFQGAGLLNVNRLAVHGIQMAGGINICADTLKGASIAGLANFNKVSDRSLEVAGLINTAYNGNNNAQWAGLLNITAEGKTRLQVSGFMNSAKKITGAQIGIFNYADSASGVPIGFLSIVKSGLHQIEVSGDELLYANIALRTGVKAFYNIFTGGIQPFADKPLWSFGYGAGSGFKIKNKLSADLSVTYNHISSGTFNFGTSELTKVGVGIEYRIAKNIAIAAGPTFNIFWSDKLSLDYPSTYSKIAPYTLFDKTTSNDFNFKGWVGGKVAIRFL